MNSQQEKEDEDRWLGFTNQEWQVHKFGGTSVANSDCFRLAAGIVEEQISEDIRLCVVVSAMGGKPKVTDLLLQSVEAAAQRNSDGVEKFLNLVLQKHEKCLQELFEDQATQDALLDTVSSDIHDIKGMGLSFQDPFKLKNYTYADLSFCRFFFFLFLSRYSENCEPHEVAGKTNLRTCFWIWRIVVGANIDDSVAA